MKKLENKVAVITGGGSGIGAATAKLFVQEGAKVLIVSRAEEQLRMTMQDINHENISYCLADTSKAEDTQRYIQAAVERYGGIDVLVGNAGIEGPFKHILEHSVEDFDQVVATNIRGSWLAAKYAFPELKKRGGGNIIFTSSILGVTGFSGASAYITSKHAVVGITRALAYDGAPHHIRVNAVCPGTIDNGMMTSVHRKIAPGAEEQVKSTLAARAPLKRYGTSEEIAKTNLFLASDDSSFTTGGVFVIDGGVTAGFM